MINAREPNEKETTVGFRLPQYVVALIDILCKQEDLNRSQFLRRALDAYEPLRGAIAEFDQQVQSIDGVSNDS
jgi:hypothetical protein